MASGLLRSRHVGPGADVLVAARVESLLVLREVPLDGLVHELAVAGPQVEGHHGGGLLRAAGDRLVRADVIAFPGAAGSGAAPRLPGHVRHEAGRIAAVEDLRRLDLPESLAMGEDARRLAERGNRRGRWGGGRGAPRWGRSGRAACHAEASRGDGGGAERRPSRGGAAPPAAPTPG